MSLHACTHTHTHTHTTHIHTHARTHTHTHTVQGGTLGVAHLVSEHVVAMYQTLLCSLAIRNLAFLLNAHVLNLFLEGSN